MSNSVFNFNFLARVLSELLRGFQVYITGPCTFWTPHSGQFFVPQVSTLPYLIVFLILIF